VDARWQQPIFGELRYHSDQYTTLLLYTSCMRLPR
jgi:hypothetical protein